MEQVDETAAELIDVFAPPTEEERAQARADYDHGARRHKKKRIDWVAVRLMFSRGAKRAVVAERFGIPEKTLQGRARRDELLRDPWRDDVGEPTLRAMARDAYVFALVVGELEGMPEGGEAAIRAALDWRRLTGGSEKWRTMERDEVGDRKRAGAGPSGLEWVSRKAAARRGGGGAEADEAGAGGAADEGDGEVGDTAGEAGGCTACAARGKIADVTGRLEGLLASFEAEAAQGGHAEAGAFLRCIRLAARGVASEPRDHLGADGRLKSWP